MADEINITSHLVVAHFAQTEYLLGALLLLRSERSRITYQTQPLQ